MVKISWTDRVRNGVLHGVKEERDIVQRINRNKLDRSHLAKELSSKTRY